MSLRNRFQGLFSPFIYDNIHLPLQHEHDVLKPFGDVVRRLGFFGSQPRRLLCFFLLFWVLDTVKNELLVI